MTEIEREFFGDTLPFLGMMGLGGRLRDPFESDPFYGNDQRDGFPRERNQQFEQRYPKYHTPHTAAPPSQPAANVMNPSMQGAKF